MDGSLHPHGIIYKWLSPEEGYVRFLPSRQGIDSPYRYVELSTIDKDEKIELDILKYNEQLGKPPIHIKTITPLEPGLYSFVVRHVNK